MDLDNNQKPNKQKKYGIWAWVGAIYGPNSALGVFKQKYPEAKDIYIIQNLFKRKS